MSSVGIIIPSFSRADPKVPKWDYVMLACESAARTPGAVVIVIDDGSKDFPGARIIRGFVPRTTEVVILPLKQNAGLSRSWNFGLLYCLRAGIEFAVCGNDDAVYPCGWWGPMREALESFSFAGPTSNAPGHSPDQCVSRYLPDYHPDDDPDEIDATQQRLADSAPLPISRTMLNGFCFAGRTEDFFRAANSPAEVFDSSIPLAGNEDDFFERVKSHGLQPAIVPKSFVFHYRSVSRGLSHGRLDRGAKRLPTCIPCQNGAKSTPN